MRRRKSRSLSSKQLRKFVLDEARKLQKEALNGKIEPVEKVKAQEYEPGEEAGQLEKDIDFLKVLKIKESRLIKQVKQIRERKEKLRRRILKNI